MLFLDYYIFCHSSRCARTHEPSVFGNYGAWKVKKKKISIIYGFQYISGYSNLWVFVLKATVSWGLFTLIHQPLAVQIGVICERFWAIPCQSWQTRESRRRQLLRFIPPWRIALLPLDVTFLVQNENKINTPEKKKIFKDSPLNVFTTTRNQMCSWWQVLCTKASKRLSVALCCTLPLPDLWVLGVAGCWRWWEKTC